MGNLDQMYTLALATAQIARDALASANRHLTEKQEFVALCIRLIQAHGDGCDVCRMAKQAIGNGKE